MAEPGFVVLGLSHRTATLAVRERASLDERQARRVLRRLVGDERLDEALVLCTCNRTELYAVATSLGAAEDALREALEAASGLAAATLACSSYLMHERMAVEHLFCVAAGLDSAVLGESEIAGQLRRAFR